MKPARDPRAHGGGRRRDDGHPRGAMVTHQRPSAQAHFDIIAESVTQGLMNVGLQTGVPTIMGVLTVNDEKQARSRRARLGRDRGARSGRDRSNIFARDPGARSRRVTSCFRRSNDRRARSATARSGAWPRSRWHCCGRLRSAARGVNSSWASVILMSRATRASRRRLGRSRSDSEEWTQSGPRAARAAPRATRATRAGRARLRSNNDVSIY